MTMPRALKRISQIVRRIGRCLVFAVRFVCVSIVLLSIIPVLFILIASESIFIKDARL
jgi:hypothetical protein